MENTNSNFEVHTMNELMSSGTSLNQSNADLNQFSPLIGGTIEENKPKTNYVKLVIIVIIFALLGTSSYFGYIYKDNLLAFFNNLGIFKKEIAENTNEEENKIEENEPVVNENEEEKNKVFYSSEFSNYFPIDTTSDNIFAEIQKELDLIRTNLPEQNFSEPISFIITNKENKPLSFSDFSTLANMSVPTEILASLDDKFEIYAFNDFSAGVRFGFRIDVKNEVALMKALNTQEQTLPGIFSVFFENFNLDQSLVKSFSDSNHNTYKVRYLNLDDTHSVDYVIDRNRWIIGTSKKTMRSILDKLDKNDLQNKEVKTDENVVEDETKNIENK